MVEFPQGWGKIFPYSKKLLLKLAKNPLKIKKTTRQYKFGELNKIFIFQTEAKPLESL